MFPLLVCSLVCKKNKKERKKKQLFALVTAIIPLKHHKKKKDTEFCLQAFITQMSADAPQAYVPSMFAQFMCTLRSCLHTIFVRPMLKDSRTRKKQTADSFCRLSFVRCICSGNAALKCLNRRSRARVFDTAVFFFFCRKPPLRRACRCRLPRWNPRQSGA